MAVNISSSMRIARTPTFPAKAPMPHTEDSTITGEPGPLNGTRTAFLADPRRRKTLAAPDQGALAHIGSQAEDYS